MLDSTLTFEYLSVYLPTSVTRFGEISILWHNFKKVLVFYWLTIQYLAKLWTYFGKFYCSKWPNIEIIRQPSGHTATYLTYLAIRVVVFNWKRIAGDRSWFVREETYLPRLVFINTLISFLLASRNGTNLFVLIEPLLDLFHFCYFKTLPTCGSSTLSIVVGFEPTTNILATDPMDFLKIWSFYNYIGDIPTQDCLRSPRRSCLLTPWNYHLFIN